jgi:L,D-transpeptidase YbiS
MALGVVSIGCQGPPTNPAPAPQPAAQVSEPAPLPAPAETQAAAPAPEDGVNTLTDEQWAYLASQGWNHSAGESALGVWVSVDEQMFRVIRGREIVWEVPCATAANGTGSLSGSYKTPLGWHVVKRKTGANAPWGQVFRGGQPTSEIWKPGQSTKEDLVLTRILFLDGLEPGKNKGGNVDSYNRKIYIHGTNDEARIGTPSSHGCVRLRNDDAIAAYDLIPEGTPVLITERATAAAAPVPPSV